MPPFSPSRTMWFVYVSKGVLKILYRHYSSSIWIRKHVNWFFTLNGIGSRDEATEAVPSRLCGPDIRRDPTPIKSQKNRLGSRVYSVVPLPQAQLSAIYQVITLWQALWWSSLEETWRHRKHPSYGVIYTVSGGSNRGSTRLQSLTNCIP